MKLMLETKRITVGLLSFGLLTLFLSACPKKQTVKKTEEEPTEQSDEVQSDELDVHGKDFVSSKDLETIHFDYDSSQLKEDSRLILSRNADYLKKNSDLEVLCEGHTDERGTVGYNLALGQKRAQSVRKYYIALGLESKSLGSLSFGKEKPLCPENAEDCWLKNRRVETKVRSLKIADGVKDKEQKPEEETR